MKATVVIPTFNRAQRVSELLHCLTNQGDSLARIVVCDDGSDDDTVTVVRSFEVRLPLVYARQENRGFRAGQARNMGIGLSVGEVIIFVDDDVLVAKDFVASHVAAHGDSTGGRVAIGYRSRTHSFRREQPTPEAIGEAEADDRAVELGVDGNAVRTHPTPWFFVYSCNFSVSRGSSESAWPLFDEAFVGWGMEDIEFGYRLHRAGYQVVAAPLARVLHIEDPRPRDPFRCEVRGVEPVYDSYVRNSVYLLDKYPGDAALARVIHASLRWYVRDEARGCWVKNGHANDVDAVLAYCRSERHHVATDPSDAPINITADEGCHREALASPAP